MEINPLVYHTRHFEFYKNAKQQKKKKIYKSNCSTETFRRETDTHTTEWRVWRIFVITWGLNVSNKNPFWGFFFLHFSKDRHSTHKTKKQFDRKLFHCQWKMLVATFFSFFDIHTHEAQSENMAITLFWLWVTCCCSSCVENEKCRQFQKCQIRQQVGEREREKKCVDKIFRRRTS